MNTQTIIRIGAIAVALSGIALHLLIEANGKDSSSSFFLMLTSIPPFVVCLFLSLKKSEEWPPLSVLMAGVLPLGLSLRAYYDVFIHPQSSTAALVFLALPLANIVSMFVGAGLGFLLHRLFFERPQCGHS